MSATLFGLLLSVPIVTVLFLRARGRDRRARDRAQREGALWGGDAGFLDARKPTITEVRLALEDVGAMYGSALSTIRQRPVSGELYVRKDGLSWHPARYSGRGEAKPWTLPIDQVLGWSVDRWGFPIRGWKLTLRTETGSATMLVTDGEELTKSLAQATGVELDGDAR